MLNIVQESQATCLLWDGGQNDRTQTAIVMVATLLNTPANVLLVTGTTLSASKRATLLCGGSETMLVTSLSLSAVPAS